MHGASPDFRLIHGQHTIKVLTVAPVIQPDRVEGLLTERLPRFQTAKPGREGPRDRLDLDLCVPETERLL
jgi:hypothetical protein